MGALELLNPQNSAVIFIDFQPQMFFGVARVWARIETLTRWKTWRTKPASMPVPWVLNPLIGKLRPPLKALLGAIGIVMLLTWVIMPLFVKIQKRWL